MANAQITTKTGNVIEVAWEDVLRFLTKVQTLTLKGPQIIAAVTVILTAVDKTLANFSTDAANPLTLVNIAIDEQQLADVKAVWADIKALFKI